MVIIHVPRPPRSAWNPNRKVSSLLKMQVEQLHHAARRLPLQYRSEAYINAIKTEGEAAKYIREMTQAIRDAHDAAENARRAPKRKKVIEIAAVADARPKRKAKKKSSPKKSKSKPKKKTKKR
jgi:ArsR family metal-binding transcriptional regulator